MTTYAYDRTASSIIAVWETGAGAVAKRVARVPSRATEPPVLRLAKAMTGLSSILWHAYTDPHLVGPPSARLALRGLRHPDLPLDGVLMRRGDPLVDSAHEVGRAVGEAGARAWPGPSRRRSRPSARPWSARCGATSPAAGGRPCF
ncbi:hypothetical protein [Pseudonocardia sp. T1-2H]|uniref:hypothetical protein n=1 Tax=Pseudonocardia sp. T1-2H TaxID=3128899 RepID=UPI0031010019